MADTTITLYGGMFDSTEITDTVDGFPVGNKAVGGDFFAKMISSLYGNGVSIHGEPDAFLVAAGGGMTLTCQPGAAWINGYMAWNKEPQTLPIAAGKNYAVCLRLNTAAGTFSLLCAENPGEGTYPVRSGAVYDLVLARVSVPGTAVSASDALIEDCRQQASLCGVVTSAADSLDAISFAANAGMLGGHTANEYLKITGGTLTGRLQAARENTGASVVRNISYGSVPPTDLREGDVFLLLS